MTLTLNCAACDKPILDKFIFNVLNRTYHQKCIKCYDCKLNLNDKCYTKYITNNDNNDEIRLYCKDDFFKRYAPKCTSCLETILPKDLIIKTKILNTNRIYHIKCFNCFICNKQLNSGDNLYYASTTTTTNAHNHLSHNNDNNNSIKLMCKYDYMKMQQSQYQGKIFNNF